MSTLKIENQHMPPKIKYQKQYSYYVAKKIRNEQAPLKQSLFARETKDKNEGSLGIRHYHWHQDEQHQSCKRMGSGKDSSHSGRYCELDDCGLEKGIGRE